MLNTFCPGRGSNQDLLRGSQTLNRVAIKAGLYHKAVQVCIIPNITTPVPSSFFFLSFFLIQFNVHFKIISLIETCQSIGGAKREYPGKTT